jgi:hypothetical protein
MHATPASVLPLSGVEHPVDLATSKQRRDVLLNPAAPAASTPARNRPQIAFIQVGGESAVTLEVCLAERVGFVPDEPTSLNDLGRIGTARNRQIL